MLTQHAAVAQLIDDPGEERVYVVLEYLEKGPVHQDGCVPACVVDTAATPELCVEILPSLQGTSVGPGHSRRRRR